MLYLVYKAQVNDVYTNGEETYDQTNDIYWYTAYYDLLVNPEGVTTVDLTDYSTPGDSFTIDSGISSGWWSTKSWYNYIKLQLLQIQNPISMKIMSGKIWVPLWNWKKKKQMKKKMA